LQAEAHAPEPRLRALHQLLLYHHVQHGEDFDAATRRQDSVGSRRRAQQWKAIALAFAREGADLILVARERKAELDQVANDCNRR
jgi:hypothetical protein